MKARKPIRFADTIPVTGDMDMFVAVPRGSREDVHAVLLDNSDELESMLLGDVCLEEAEE